MGRNTMIESISTFIGLLRDWRSFRSEKKREHLDRWIEPTYKAANDVITDMLEILLAARRAIEADDNPRLVMRIIEDRRIRYMTLRNELRAYLSSSRSVRYFGEFDEGIRILLQGVLGTNRSGSPESLELRRNRIALDLDDHQIKLSGHTLLDVLTRLTTHPELFSKVDMLDAISQQTSAIESASRTLSRGYVGLRQRYLKNE